MEWGEKERRKKLPKRKYRRKPRSFKEVSRDRKGWKTLRMQRNKTIYVWEKAGEENNCGSMEKKR